MRVTILGYGEIGKAVHSVVSAYYDVAIHDPALGHVAPPECDVLLVCIPYSDAFVDAVESIASSAIIVFSTVPIGTCRSINAIHSPVEGKHPHLAESLRLHKRWVGGSSPLADELLATVFGEVTHLKRPEYTEWLKLRSTTLYGVNIEYARYSANVSDELGMDYDLCRQWDSDYNDLYRDLGMPWAQRYLLDRPAGPKGGHCVTPNARLLIEQHPDPLVAIVAEQ